MIQKEECISRGFAARDGYARQISLDYYNGSAAKCHSTDYTIPPATQASGVQVSRKIARARNCKTNYASVQHIISMVCTLSTIALEQAISAHEVALLLYNIVWIHPCHVFGSLESNMSVVFLTFL